jgi:hypothetical protein
MGIGGIATATRVADEYGFTVANTLVLDSTVYGLSKRICVRIQASLREKGEQAEVAPLVGHGFDPAAFDAIVVGASIKHGKHQPSGLESIRSHQALLEAKPSALFSVNLVARKPAKNTPRTNPYLQSGAAWFFAQGSGAADGHIVAARAFGGLLLLHLVGVALHLLDFVRE